MSKLTEALLAVQKELTKVDFPKTAKNPHFNSNYCPLDKIMEKVLPVLHKHGILLIQRPCFVHGPDGVVPALWTSFEHPESDDSIGDTMILAMAKMDPQKQGAGITYARRFALQAFLGIVPEDDDDGNAASGQTKAREFDSPDAPF